MSSTKKRTNKKRAKGRGVRRQQEKKKKKERSIEEMMGAAEEAVNSGMLEEGISLYSTILSKIHNDDNNNNTGASAAVVTAKEDAAKIDGTIRKSDDEKQQQNDDNSLSTVVDVLEKRAEARVSVGDQDGALEDYTRALECIARLEGEEEEQYVQPPPNKSCDTTTTTSTTNALQPVTTSLNYCDRLERKGGLFLYAGQLSQGKDALRAYQQGVECFQKSLEVRLQHQSQRQQQKVDRVVQEGPLPENDTNEKKTPRASLSETRQQLSSAFCSVAELYLTDLCEEENAEQECESYISQALEIRDDDDDSCSSETKDDNDGGGGGGAMVDALQTAANLRLSQSRNEEAVDYILRAYGKMRVGCEALAALVGLGQQEEGKQREGVSAEEEEERGAGATELLELDAAQGLPGFEFRCQTAKILLECAGHLKNKTRDDDNDRGDDEGKSSSNTCVRAAVNVLGSLLAENDEVVEIWFLTGDAFAAMQPHNGDLARQHWERAVEMLQSVKESLEEQQQSCGGSCTDEEADDLERQLDEVNCQLDELQVRLEEIGSEGRGDDDEDDSGGPQPMEE